MKRAILLARLRAGCGGGAVAAARPAEAREEARRLLADLPRLGAEEMAPLVQELLASLGPAGDRRD